MPSRGSGLAATLQPSKVDEAMAFSAIHGGVEHKGGQPFPTLDPTLEAWVMGAGRLPRIELSVPGGLEGGHLGS